MSSAGPSGSAAFDKYYRSVYKDRWPSLLDALLLPSRHVALLNPFASRAFAEQHLRSLGAAPFLSDSGSPVFPALPCFGGADQGDDWAHSPPPRDPSSGLLAYFLLDAASLCAPVALAPTNGINVCDMCAAPGGKSLAMAFMMLPSGPQPDSTAQDTPIVKGSDSEDTKDDEPADGASDAEANSGAESEEDSDSDDGMVHRTSLVCNEASQARRQRLQQVVKDYLPLAQRTFVSLTGHDATQLRWVKAHVGRFDSVLLDAPCSSDRHVLQDASELARWGVARTRAMAERQVALLSNAVTALKPRGRLVYSTCSLSPIENDEVVEKVVSKAKRQPLAVRPPAELLKTLPFGECTRSGVIVLPDACGWGPLYISLIERV